MKKLLTFFFLLIAFSACGQVSIPPGVSGASRTVMGYPDAPSELAAEAQSNTEIVVTWNDNSNNETGFVLEWSTTSGSGYTTINIATDVVSYEHSGLSPGTVYYYRIKAVRNTAESSYSAEASTITTLAPPTNLGASTVSSSQINLTWDDNSSIETGYAIERSTTQGSGYSVIHTTAANVESYNNTGLTENTTYYYRVQAIGSAVNSAYSDEASATTSPALNAPSDLSATAVSNTQIDLAWTDNSSNETGFEIYRAPTSGGTFALIHTTAANVSSYSNTGLTTSTAYYYKIRAVNAQGETAYTAEASATTQSGTAPSAPTTLATTSATSSAIALSWADNSSNETGFEIERSVDTNTSFSLLTTTAAGATSYSDTGLDEGRRYYYRVRATNGSGNSGYTSQVNEITTWSTAVSYIGKGTAATSTTSSISVPLPSNPTEGRIMVMIVGTKNGRVWADTPTGWQSGANEGFVDYHGGQGTDRGAVVGNVFWKICGASESGNVNVSLYNTPNSAHAVIFLFEKDANAFWSVDIVGSAHRSPTTTSYSATSYEKLNIIKGDALFVADIINSDNMTWSGQDVTHSGTTLTETSEEIADLACTAGQHQRMVASLYHVTSNTSNNQKAVRTMTGASSTTDSPLGITLFVRLRNARTSPTYTSQPRVWRAADIVNTTQSAYDALNIWDGRRVSVEGPDPLTTKLSIATFNGRPCMKYFADFTTGVNRRSETSYAWQPILPLGTQIIEEWKMETDATATQAVGEWIFMQHHTGTAPGGPYPQNNPLIYLAWSSVGQTGWDNLPGSSPGGELVIVNNARDGSDYLRYRSNAVTWGPNKTYRFRMHIRFDIASGDPVLKVWAAEDGDPFTLVFENYTYQTVAMTNAEIGSYPLCGGTTKLAIYHHMITNETTRAASVAAGHTGVTLYVPCHKSITQLPGDSFYVTDYTNNELDIYDLVNTSTE